MTTTTREIDDYVTAVHAALADLSDADREDLLDDLPQHLADVQADRGGTLVELIGTPAAYAAELRATAGLDANPRSRPWPQAMRHQLARADERLGSALNYDRFVDLLRALAPGWWLVRAYLIVQVCTNATSRFGSHALVPQVAGSRVAGVVLLIVACAGSVWLGRRGFTHEWHRVVSVLLGLALLWYGIALVKQIDETATVYVNSSDNVDGNDVSGVTNVYPVGPDGSVLNGIRLYDQDGNPITLGTDCPDGTFNPADPNDLGSPGVDDGAAATSAPTYPLTCQADRGPFPSGRASALPSTSASSVAPSSPAPTVPPSSAPVSSSASPSR